MARLLAVLAAVPICLAAPAAAQESGELAWLAGGWRGEGVMFGNPSEATLDVRSVLGGRFLEFSYRAGAFEGRAFYRAHGEGDWRAHWFDNRGVSFGIEARAESRTLTSEWGSAETERGRTVYRLMDDGSLELTDSVLGRDGAWRDFARHVLRRTN